MKIISGLYEPVKLEEQIAKWWVENEIFRKIVESRKGRPLFRFLEGPPTVNGFMHVGHARGRTMKDVILRYKTMAGYDVWRRAGWDCQGLPVELEVEKKLNVSSKKEIEEKIGLQRFVEECNNLVDYYLEFWRKASVRLGLSLDYNNAYETRRKDYIEFVWWTLKEADKKRLLIEAFKVVPKCPRCETSLSSHEVAQGYSTTTDPSIYVKFQLGVSSNEFMIVWTTTPWTIPGNEALSVHPSYSYVKLKVENEIFLMAEERVKAIMEELKIKDYEVIESFPGKVLEGMKYVHPLENEVQAHKGHKGKYDHTIICSEHVTLKEGTGCVHTAPAHGPEDFEVGKKYGLQIFCPVDSGGKFTSEGGKYNSMFVKDADELIIKDLDKKRLLLKAGIVEHEYPFCWRCNAPLIYLADKQWFLRVAPLKERILQENRATDWIPEWAGLGRFEDWLLNAEDWCISRSRIWGSPLNVWVCENCGNKHVVGTIKELKQLAKNLPEDVNLHRPWIDQIILNCPQCNGDMKRIEYVIDCWLDSGVAHTASLGLTSTSLLDRLYPYDFITEAIDQTRGWFYSLVFTGVMVYDKSPYKRVLCQGHMLDKYGQKMSKSKGNVVWALDAMDKVGADPLRLYELFKSSPWDFLAFDYDEIEQVKRQLSILWNLCIFATTYMDLDEFNPKVWTVDKINGSLRSEDRWLLSKMQSLIRAVTKNLNTLALHQSVRNILTFITDDLSRFYTRLVRRRTWTEKDNPDKLAAYTALYECLATLLKLLAPFTPYLVEELYQALVRSVDSTACESVHLCDWPKPSSVWLDEKLEEEMSVIKDLLTKVLHARQKANLKLRWPVKEVYFAPSNEQVSKTVEKLREILIDQANTKKLRLLTEDELPPKVTLKVGLNFDIAGPMFKEKTVEITHILNTLNGLTVKKKIAEAGKYTVMLSDGSAADLFSDTLVFDEVLPDTIVSIASTYGHIYLDISRTPELLAESTAREIIRRTQIMRKELNLRVEEYIDLAILVTKNDTLEALNSLSDFITEETRAKELAIIRKKKDFKPFHVSYNKEWNINGEIVKIAVTRLGQK